MGRPTRIDYPGAWHHVMNRTARRAPIFDESEHARAFLRSVGRTVDRFQIEVHAYGLVPNHYHLQMRSVRGNLSAAMKFLGGDFTRAVNFRQRWDGPVFRSRFRSQLIEDEGYLLTVAAYIHLNPVRAGIASVPEHCAWTSHRAYLGLELPPEWLSRSFITDLAGGNQAFANFVVGVAAAPPPSYGPLFKEHAHLRPDGGRPARPLPLLRGTDFVGNPVRPVPEVLSEVEELTGFTQRRLLEDLRGRVGNPARCFAAWAMSRECGLSYAQIGESLAMSAGAVSKSVHRTERRPSGLLAQWRADWLRTRGVRQRLGIISA